MTQEEVFNEMDILIYVKMEALNKALSDITQFIKDQNIPLSTPINSDDEKIGEVLLTALQSLRGFLVEYKGIKDTWYITST
jgi:hypothetical protein